MAEHEDKERSIVLERLYRYKPWLRRCLPKLRITKPDIIRKNFPITDQEVEQFDEI